METETPQAVRIIWNNPSLHFVFRTRTWINQKLDRITYREAELVYLQDVPFRYTLHLKLSALLTPYSLASLSAVARRPMKLPKLASSEGQTTSCKCFEIMASETVKMLKC